MTTFTIRTRYVKATNFHGSRIRVERVSESGRATEARTLAYNYAADNPHVGAAIEYLQAQGINAFRVYWSRETRSGQGNVYRVEVVG